METKFKRVIDEVKARSRKLRKDGRSCCARQLLHVSTFLENELKHVKIRKETK